jgi:hypothetical protein
MFPSVATRAERDEMLEQVRAQNGVVHGEPLAGAAANAAVSVPEPRGLPQPLPGGAVELGAGGTRALRAHAARTAAARSGRDKCATARTNVAQHPAQLVTRVKRGSKCPVGGGVSAAIAIRRAYVLVWTNKAAAATVSASRQIQIGSSLRGSRGFSDYTRSTMLARASCVT